MEIATARKHDIILNSRKQPGRTFVIFTSVRSRTPNSVSLDKSNTFFIFFAFIFVRVNLCLKLNVAAVMVRSSAD